MYFIRLLQPIIPAIALGLTACASIPAETPALPKFQRIAIITTGTTRKDLQADSTTYIDATRIGGGAVAGELRQTVATFDGSIAHFSPDGEYLAVGCETHLSSVDMPDAGRVRLYYAPSLEVRRKP